MRAADIDALVELRELSRAEVLERLGIDDAAVDDGYRYQSLDGLAMATTDQHGGARIYFDGERVAMIAVGDPSVDAAALRARMGADVVELASRQAKLANLEVDAAAGLAFSAVDDEVGFVEIFPPTTADDYQQRIYKEPGPFRR